jgi:hypothetical protein
MTFETVEGLHWAKHVDVAVIKRALDIERTLDGERILDSERILDGERVLSAETSPSSRRNL